MDSELTTETAEQRLKSDSVTVHRSRALPYFEETGKFSLALPNAVNMAFHFPSVLKGLLICAFMPGTLLLEHVRSVGYGESSVTELVKCH